MIDLRETPDLDLRTLNVGDKFIDADGMIKKVIRKNADTITYVSVE